MTKITFFILIFFSFYSCNNKEETIEYSKFIKQITPSEKFAIYEYTRNGDMSFSSGISVTELFPIEKKFEEGKGIKIEGAIKQWISEDTLLVYDFRSKLKQPKDTLPIKTLYKNIGDFVVKTINYKSNSGGTNRYKFDSVWTNNKNIYIRFVYNEKNKNIRSFPLGSVSIKTDKDSIKSIEIFGELSKNMRFTYQNPDGTISKNLPGISTTHYEYTPIKKISASKLNKTKIFYGK
ncbi:hypothetical protein [Flavobacterium sp.]|uniref:hypothetical protein n=1 Tax=Flavobacterium sp. TaxID=239 RepID=UPI0033412BD6